MLFKDQKSGSTRTGCALQGSTCVDWSPARILATHPHVTDRNTWIHVQNRNHGIFSATIDNNPSQNFSGVAPSLVTQQLLFTTKVEPGTHNLIIINEEGLPFGVDYFACASIAASERRRGKLTYY